MRGLYVNPSKIHYGCHRVINNWSISFKIKFLECFANKLSKSTKWWKLIVDLIFFKYIINNIGKDPSWEQRTIFCFGKRRRRCIVRLRTLDRPCIKIAQKWNYYIYMWPGTFFLNLRLAQLPVIPLHSDHWFQWKLIS